MVAAPPALLCKFLPWLAVVPASGLIVVAARLPALPLAPVPVTLQSLAVMLAGALLGPWRGAAAVLLYLLSGLAGLPVFAGGASGPAVLHGPSAGYLAAFPLAALLCGALVRRVPDDGRPGRGLLLFACGLGSSALLLHPLGIAGLVRALDISVAQALAIDARFWPGDVLKNTLLALLVGGWRKARRAPRPAPGAPPPPAPGHDRGRH